MSISVLVDSALDPETKVFRYLTIEKYIDLLTSTSLFFPSIKKLKETNDAMEGFIPKVLLDKVISTFVNTESEMRKESFESGVKQLTRVAYEANIANRSQQEINTHISNLLKTSGVEEMCLERKPFDFAAHQKIEDFACANCWNKNDYTSISMWKLYTDNGKGVAIQSTIGRLKNALLNASHDNINKIKIAPVVYVNHFETEFPAEDFILKDGDLPHGLIKAPEFRSEEEVRLLIMPNNEIDYQDKVPIDYSLKINILSLIENIYISPFSNHLFDKAIISLAKNKGIEEDKIVKSDSQQNKTLKYTRLEFPCN